LFFGLGKRQLPSAKDQHKQEGEEAMTFVFGGKRRLGCNEDQCKQEGEEAMAFVFLVGSNNHQAPKTNANKKDRRQQSLFF